MSDKSTDIAPAERKPTKGDYTGERIKSSKPETYKEICKLLADPSNTIKSISERTGVTRQTISAILHKQTADVQVFQDRLAKVLQQITQIGGDRVLERLMDEDSDDNLMQLDNAIGVAFDKLRLLRDQSTSNVDMRVQSVPSHDQFAAELEAAGVSVDADDEDEQDSNEQEDSNEQQDSNPWE